MILSLKVTYFPNFGFRKNPLEIQNVRLYSLFNAFHQENFQENLINAYKGNLKNVDIRPKNVPTALFWA